MDVVNIFIPSLYFCFEWDLFVKKAMIILHFKDPGHPWDWIPSGGGQDYRAEEWDGEKISKLELYAASPFARNSATEYIFPLQISETGSYAELLAKRGDFSDFIVEQLQGTEDETEEEEVKEVETLTKGRNY